MAKRGIDVSAHNGNIDLVTLSKNGVDFVIIRVGFGTKGTLDTKFKRNADLCVQNGIPFGFYWYSYALSVEAARQEAHHILNAIAPYKDKYSYGVWFDMEDADGYKRKNGMPSNQTLREMCAAFCSTVEAEGYENTIERHILIEEMRRSGIFVRVTEDESEHYAVIDHEIVWHGGINLLGKEDAWDNLIRIRNKQVAEELIEISYVESGK